MFLTRIAGNGVAFLSGGGTIMQKQLQPGERYMLGDTQSFVAAEASIGIGPLAHLSALEHASCILVRTPTPTPLSLNLSLALSPSLNLTLRM